MVLFRRTTCIPHSPRAVVRPSPGTASRGFFLRIAPPGWQRESPAAARRSGVWAKVSGRPGVTPDRPACAWLRCSDHVRAHLAQTRPIATGLSDARGWLATSRLLAQENAPPKRGQVLHMPVYEGRSSVHVCLRGVGGLSLSRPRGRAQGGPNAQPRMHPIDDGTSLGRTMVNDPDRGSRARLSRHLTDLRSTPHRWRRWPLLARPHVAVDEPFRVLREVLVGIESAL